MKNVGPWSSVAVAWGGLTTQARVSSDGDQDQDTGEQMAAPELEDEIQMMVEDRVQVNDAELLRPGCRGQGYGDSGVEAELRQSRDEGGEHQESHSEESPVRTGEADNEVVTETERSLIENQFRTGPIKT